MKLAMLAAAAAAVAGIAVAPAAAMAAGPSPLAGAQPAAAGIVFKTTVPNLAIRSQPNTKSPVVKRLGPAGTPVTLVCWTRGEHVQSSKIWYRTSAPAVGYVASHFVNTGRDPNPRIRKCA
jgi:hypothetical protein